MDPRDLALMLRFNQWADDVFLEAVGRADREVFTRHVSSSHPSLRDTLVHILWAQELWLQRWQGQSPQGSLDPALFPDVPGLRARWADVHRRQTEFVRELGAEDTARNLSYLNPKGERWTYPLWQMMVHAFNHSTFHRGQLVTLFRQLGLPPVTTDFLVFIDEESPVPTPTRLRVVLAYESPFPGPLAFRRGERFAFERKPTEWAGWIWCRAADGRSAWVPESWVAIAGEHCTLVRDYDAVELSVEAGEEVVAEWFESGFAWATDARGRRGWVPLRCLGDPA